MLEVIRWQYLKIKFQNQKRIPVLQTGNSKLRALLNVRNATNLKRATKYAPSAVTMMVSK